MRIPRKLLSIFADINTWFRSPLFTLKVLKTFSTDMRRELFRFLCFTNPFNFLATFPVNNTYLLNNNEIDGVVN